MINGYNIRLWFALLLSMLALYSIVLTIFQDPAYLLTAPIYISYSAYVLFEVLARKQ